MYTFRTQKDLLRLIMKKYGYIPRELQFCVFLWILKQSNIHQNSLLEETFGTRLFSSTSRHTARTTLQILLLWNKNIAPRFHLRKQNKLKKNNAMLIFMLSASVEIKTIIEENLQYISPKIPKRFTCKIILYY